MTLPIVQQQNEEVESSNNVKTSRQDSTPSLKYAQAAAAASPSATTKGKLSLLFIPLISQLTNFHKKIENSILSAWNEPPKIVDQLTKSSSSSTTTNTTETTTKKTLLSSQYSAASATTTPTMSNGPDVRLPASLADLAPSFESVKNKALRSSKEGGNSQYTNQMLDVSLQHVPDLIDSERPKVYQPRNPFNTPNYYPQQPLAIFDNPVLFDKFDMDTLFYIFYYQQGTYQQ
jgi:CCR4-NOT transcription complex subunit 3